VGKRKTVLQPVAKKAPFKKPVGGKALPQGGPALPAGLPGVPGDPTAGGQGAGRPASGVKGGTRGVVDANSLYSVTHYGQGEGSTEHQAESPVYGSGPGLGPQTDIRPPTPGIPSRVSKTGGADKPAAVAPDQNKYRPPD
jgi:hypothetical protein